MKSLFLLLLLANLVFFYVQRHWLDESPVEVVLQSETLALGVQRLVLLSEQTPAVQEVPPRDGLTPLEALVPGTGSKAETGPAGPGNTPALDQGTLKMLDPIDEAPPFDPTSASPICFTLGPFTKITTADEAAAAFEALGISVQRQGGVEKSPQGFGVYLPASKDFAAASVMLKRLQAAGFKDLYLIPKGPQKNAISLGLFTQKTAAARREKQVRAKGFNPMLSEQFRQKTRQWLAFAIPGDKAVTAVSMAEVAGQYDGTRLEQKLCE